MSRQEVRFVVGELIMPIGQTLVECFDFFAARGLATACGNGKAHPICFIFRNDFGNDCLPVPRFIAGRDNW